MPRLTSLPLPRCRYVPDVSSPGQRRFIRQFLSEILPAGRTEEAERVRFYYGADLFDVGFYWEAHEVWEPLWLASPSRSGERAFLHGLLLATAALLRAEVGKKTAAQRLALRAEAKLQEAMRWVSEASIGAGTFHPLTERVRTRLAGCLRSG